MNADILKENPDWRWYLLFGGGTLCFTLLGWLIFKYGPVGDGPTERFHFNRTDKRHRLNHG
jgi:hypothetical protein